MKYFIIILSTVISTLLITALLFFSGKPSMQIGEKIEFGTIDNGFKFTCIPSKGRDYQMMLKQFEEYKSSNNLSDDLEVFRMTSKNYIKISNWSKYKLLPEWNHKFSRVKKE